MLAEAKLAMRVSTNAYDSEIAYLLEAGAKDITLAGCQVDGVSFTRATTSAGVTVTDTSTITDPLLIRALITYARTHFGSPDDAERMKDSYDEQKAQLISATGYGFPAPESENSNDQG